MSSKTNRIISDSKRSFAAPGSSSMYSSRLGFTVLELIIAIAIIGILALVTLVAYNGIQTRTDNSKTKSDASNAAKQLALWRVESGLYPVGSTNPGIDVSDGVTVYYDSDGETYILTAVSDRKGSMAYCVTSESQSPTEGACDGHSEDIPSTPEEPSEPVITYMQEVSNVDCPDERTLAVDARDNHTYWIKKIGSTCWMMTDLAYDGGGDNTHGDARSLQTTSYGMDYTRPHYYKNSNMKFTTYPDEPSTSASGSGQYGYLYTYCAAMGGQSSACRTGAIGTVVPTQSSCPAGWRIPSTGDFTALTSTLGAANNSAGVGVMKSDWMAQMHGFWYEPSSFFHAQGRFSSYWASEGSGTGAARTLLIDDQLNNVNPSYSENRRKGLGVRCAM